MSQSLLDLSAEAAVTAAALTAAGEHDRLRVAAETLVRRGATARDLREAIYIASLFCGFPRGVAALAALDELDPEAYHTDHPPATRNEARVRGETLFRRLHKGTADRQLRMLAQLHPDFAETVLSEAYGRVLSRSFLALDVRELVGVTVLTVLGLDRQLRAHLSAAHNAGVTWDAIAETVAQAAQWGGIDAEPAMATLARLRATT